MKTRISVIFSFKNTWYVNVWIDSKSILTMKRILNITFVSKWKSRKICKIFFFLIMCNLKNCLNSGHQEKNYSYTHRTIDKSG